MNKNNKIAEDAIGKFLKLDFKTMSLVWRLARHQRKTNKPELTELINDIVDMDDKEFELFCKGIRIWTSKI